MKTSPAVPSNQDILSSFIDYIPDRNRLTDDDWMLRLKAVVSTLNHTDHTIILMYAELGNQSDVARRLGVSTATINRRINDIRAKVQSQIGSRP